jgi:putative transposase
MLFHVLNRAEAIRRSVNRGRPYGEAAWIERCAEKLGLEFTLRPRGRPPLSE